VRRFTVAVIIYGESIYTKRAELIGQLPFQEKTDAVLFRKRTFSRQPIRHDELYCESKIGFLQLTWDKK
jgi:hypothetical protein